MHIFRQNVQLLGIIYNKSFRDVRGLSKSDFSHISTDFLLYVLLIILPFCILLTSTTFYFPLFFFSLIFSWTERIKCTTQCPPSWPWGTVQYNIIVSVTGIAISCSVFVCCMFVSASVFVTIHCRRSQIHALRDKHVVLSSVSVF